jgi:orotidine-5'-phosphate decarboxylase
MESWERIIVALDVDTRQQALDLVRILRGRVGLFKIGSQLFTAEGVNLVGEVLGLGERVFLDLKFHDIPNTVAKAVGVASSMGISMLTLHTLGGSKMMKAAAEALQRAKSASLTLLGVTVLTSLGEDDLHEVGIAMKVPDQVSRLGMLAQRSGLGGVVASPQEVSGLRSLLGPAMVLVTPGIRPAGSDMNDQNRIATPAAAIAAGADYLVVGRPITAAADPLWGLQNILEAF